MAKSIAKEIIIILLLCLAIIIVLGLLLYEYVPMSKVIPEPVSYRTPEDIEEEIAQNSDIDESEVIMTYEVNSSELNDYQKVKKYNPGKANPFSSYQTNVDGNSNTTGKSSSTTSSATGSTNSGTTSTGSTSGETSSGDSSSDGSSSSNSSSGSSSSGGTYFQNKGTK